MKKISMLLVLATLFGFMSIPAMAGDLADNPAANSIVSAYNQRTGEAMPQAVHGFLFDLVTNAYSKGWGSIVAITNYDLNTRIRVNGVLVPKDATIDDVIWFHVYLNPAEVKYINPGNMPSSGVVIDTAPAGVVGLDNTNGWMWIWGEDNVYFGAGVLIYNTSATITGMIWEDGWDF